MPFRADTLRRLALAALLLGVGAAAQAQAASTPAGAEPPLAATAAAFTPVPLDAIEHQVQTLRDEEHFGHRHPERYLRFKADDNKQPQRPKGKPDTWWRDFSLWLSQVGRVGVWTLGAFAVALLVVLALRARRQAEADAALDIAGAAPSRVRGYDIRPESLPADVGAAARALWQAGDHRAALVLLYRGALSLLVHRHAVPVRASSTEGDCMRLAARHLDASRSRFFERVTRARLLASYADRWPDDAEVLALCDGFTPCLGRVPMAPAFGAPAPEATA